MSALTHFLQKHTLIIQYFITDSSHLCEQSVNCYNEVAIFILWDIISRQWNFTCAHFSLLFSLLHVRLSMAMKLADEVDFIYVSYIYLTSLVRRLVSPATCVVGVFIGIHGVCKVFNAGSPDVSSFYSVFDTRAGRT
jgi:hypothetical protein